LDRSDRYRANRSRHIQGLVRETFLPFARPSIGEEEIAEVADALRSGWITTGPRVKAFELAFAEYIGVSHAIAVSSCTAALHIALAAHDIGPGDEVIMPTLTFCSTANVVVHLGAKPVLVDVGDGFNVTAETIEAAMTPRTRAIVPVHFAGQPCELDAVVALARHRGVAVVQDAAHALGASYRGERIGAIGPVTAFSFYATKNLTTGEGGMLTTDDGALADRMRRMALHGMSRDAWKRYTNAGSWFYEVLEAGFKNNMTDIQAALGLHQLRKFESFQARRGQIVARYQAAFADLPELELPTTEAHRAHAWHLYVVRLTDRARVQRDAFIGALKARNIGTSVHFIPVHLHPFYRERFGYHEGQLPRAESIYRRVVSLPLYPALSDTDVDDVIDAVRETLREAR
jgi:dTDP-4-amino-4,6-dideoxygalactose transaminase